MNLEEHIKQNRQELDVHEPNPMLWQKIEAKLPAKKVPKYKLWWTGWAVAAVVCIVSLTWVLKSPPQTPPVTAEAQMPPDFLEAERFYKAQIQQTKAQVISYKQSLPEMEPEFWAQQDTLNKAYQALREEWESGNNQEVVLQAMLQNLQIQMQVLQQQAEIVRQVRKLKETES